MIDIQASSFDAEPFPILSLGTSSVDLSTSGDRTYRFLRGNLGRSAFHKGSSGQSTSATSPAIDGERESKVEATPNSIRANWTRIAGAKLSAETYEKIRRIARREDGWRGDGSRALTADALRGFLEFWFAVRANAVEPALALTSDGGVEAHWRSSNRKHLDLHFGDSRRIFFGLINGTSIHEGVDMSVSVVNFLNHHSARPLLWK